MKKVIVLAVFLALVGGAIAFAEDNPTALIDVRLCSGLRSPEGKTLQVWAFPAHGDVMGIGTVIQVPQPDKEVVAKFKRVVSAFLNRGWKPFWGIISGELDYEVNIDYIDGGNKSEKSVLVERQRKVRNDDIFGEVVYYDDPDFATKVVTATERLDRRAKEQAFNGKI